MLTVRRTLASITVLSLGALLLVVAAAPAGAQTFTVSVFDDDGSPNTFSWAVGQAANTDGDDVIEFTPGNYTVSGGDATHVSADDLEVNGNGAVIDMEGSGVRALVVGGGGDVTVNDLTVIGGAPSTGGGAVFASADAGDVTVNDSTFSGHTGGVGAGAIMNYGGGTLTLNRSTLSGNSSTTGSHGGAVYSAGPVVVADTVFSGNAAVAGNGGGLAADAGFTVDRSLFLDNDAGTTGGGLYARFVGGTVRNTTFADNELTGAFTSGAGLSAPDLTVDHGLFSGNDGAAANVAQLSSNDPATITRTLLVEPGADDKNCGGDINRTTEYTIASDDSCHFHLGLQQGDVQDFTDDPLLGPLRDNGGVIPTRFPLAGSVVRDAVDGADCSLVEDARAVARPFPAGGACDIGPVEATYPPSTLTDVPAWVTDAVAWITSTVNDPQLMTGYDDDTFRPNDPITRGQVVRMLYRLMGEPDVDALPAHPFTDVPAWVEDAVRWASAGQIVTGITPTTFVPDDPITRAQVVRMLYRTVGMPDVDALPAHPFTDVPAWVEDAVRWAANTENPLPLVTGITPTTFVPNDDITRAQVARTTYRLAITPTAWDTPAADTVPFVAPA